MKTGLRALFLIVVLALVACAPKAAPTPAPAPSPAPATAPSGPSPTSNLPPVRQAQGIPPTSQDPAWDKVIAAAKREGLVTNYSFYFVSDIGQALAKAFQEKYGIRVETMASSGRTLREKVRAEQRIGQPIADLTQSGVSSAVEMMQDGLTVSAVGEFPELKDKSAFIMDPVYDPDKMILFYAPTYSSALINTRLVKPEEEPQSYLDLLQPRWKGKLIDSDPRGGGGGGFMWVTTMRFFKILDDDYFRRFAKQEPALFGGSSTEVYRMIGRGEYALSPTGGGTSSAPFHAEGAPLKAIGMKEGTVLQGESLVVLKNAPHPNAARLFTNWLFSPEGQTVYAKAGSRSPIRKDVPDFLHPSARVEPKRLVVRTWEAALASEKDLKSGILEEFFGKR